MKLVKTIVLTLIALGLASSLIQAQSSGFKLSGKYRIVQVGESKFKRGLEMAGREQNEYAMHLTTYALTEIQSANGSQASLDQARRLIGLALHLSPKNRESVIANVQLSKGIMPKMKKKGYNKTTLSTLLFARGNTLKASEGAPNQLLAQAFMTLAAELNPSNEDAIYEAAILEQDNGKLNWGQFTGR